MIAILLLACGEPVSADATDDTTPASDTAQQDESTDSPASCEGVTPTVTELSSAELSTMLESKDFAFINVHIPDAGEIPQTDTHIPYNDVDSIEDYLGGELGAKVVLYCKTGPMSASATAELVDRGYCAVYDLPEGMSGWESAGYTLQ